MHTGNAAEAAHSAIQALQELPPLPGVACELLEEATREDADLQRLAKLIEKDPGLAARIIGVANSAYFRRQNDVHTVADAIIRVLGLNLVRSLAIGISLSKPFDASGCKNFDLGQYWYTAMTTATLASRLSAHVSLDEAQLDSLFLSGLLQNLGQLALVHLLPDAMSEVFQAVTEDEGADIVALQQQHLATDEIEAGAIIARKWHLPATIRETITFRSNPRQSDEFGSLIELINFCRTIAGDMRDHCGAVPAVPDSLPAALHASPEVLGEILERLAESDQQMRSVASSLAGA